MLLCPVSLRSWTLMWLLCAGASAAVEAWAGQHQLRDGLPGQGRRDTCQVRAHSSQLQSVLRYKLDPDSHQSDKLDSDPRNLQVKSQNLWNMSLFEQGLSLYLEARIRIRICMKVKGRIRIRISIKVTSKIRIRIKVMWICNTGYSDVN